MKRVRRQGFAGGLNALRVPPALQMQYRQDPQQLCVARLQLQRLAEQHTRLLLVRGADVERCLSEIDDSTFGVGE